MNIINVHVTISDELNIGTLSKANAASLLANEINKAIQKFKVLNKTNQVTVTISDDSGAFSTCTIEE